MPRRGAHEAKTQNTQLPHSWDTGARRHRKTDQWRSTRTREGKSPQAQAWPRPELHDAAFGLVCVWVFEPQSLFGPVFLQVGELLAVNGTTTFPGEMGSVRRSPRLRLDHLSTHTKDKSLGLRLMTNRTVPACLAQAWAAEVR